MLAYALVAVVLLLGLIVGYLAYVEIIFPDSGINGAVVLSLIAIWAVASALCIASMWKALGPSRKFLAVIPPTALLVSVLGLLLGGGAAAALMSGTVFLVVNLVLVAASTALLGLFVGGRGARVVGIIAALVLLGVVIVLPLVSLSLR